MNKLAPTNVTYTILNTATAGVIPVAPAVAGKRVLIVGLFTDVGAVQELAIRDTNAVAIFGTLHTDKHASIVLPPSEIGYAVTLPGTGLEINLVNSALTSGVILWRYID